MRICFDCFSFMLKHLSNFTKTCILCQVLKRLKKHNPDGSKDNSSSAPRSSLVGGITPISLKTRQHSQDGKIGEDEDCMKARFREPYVKDNLPLNLSENVREPPSLELGPKRLKVKGPSFSHDIVEQGSSSCRLPAGEDRKAKHDLTHWF